MWFKEIVIKYFAHEFFQYEIKHVHSGHNVRCNFQFYLMDEITEQVKAFWCSYKFGSLNDIWSIFEHRLRRPFINLWFCAKINIFFVIWLANDQIVFCLSTSKLLLFNHRLESFFCFFRFYGKNKW